MRSLLKRLSPVIAYVASVALDKGFSLLTIPLAAAYLTPPEFGRIEVAAGLVEIVGLVLTFGVADTLVRDAGVAGDEERRRMAAARLCGASLVLALVAALVVQSIATSLATLTGVKLSEAALRLGLAGATVTALIEMPLVWLRLRQRTGAFLGFIAIRSVAQALGMWVALSAGMGADGILVSNGLAMVGFALLLIVVQMRDTGISFDRDSIRSIMRYGVPLVGAALAMYALGSFSRLFLVGQVPDAEIAYFGLAFKLALIAPLLHQPFALWWNPRRIEVLHGVDGLRRSADVWGLGFSVLAIGSLAVALGGPVLVHLALPAAYGPAAQLVAPVVLVCALNELCTLCNVGAYARSHGLAVLAVNAAGAGAAVIGYAVLAHRFGVHGVIVAMSSGHVVRLALFVWLGRSTAPIPYAMRAAALVGGVGCALTMFAPPAAMLAARMAWSVAAMTVVGLVILQQRLVEIPPSWRLWQRKRGALVRGH